VVLAGGDTMPAPLGSPRGASLSKRRRMADPGGILSGRRARAGGPPPLHPATQVRAGLIVVVVVLFVDSYLLLVISCLLAFKRCTPDPMLIDLSCSF
jgi:hypothetical protein